MENTTTGRLKFNPKNKKGGGAVAQDIVFNRSILKKDAFKATVMYR